MGYIVSFMGGDLALFDDPLVSTSLHLTPPDLRTIKIATRPCPAAGEKR